MRAPIRVLVQHCRSLLHHRSCSPSPNQLTRLFATHRSLPSSLLSNALDQKQRSVQHEDNLGPFRLGLAQPTLGHGEEAQVKWSELTTGGKVTRTAARTTNLTVILLGAGLSAVLIYALTSELFSKNSPTVLYGDACERIKTSPRLTKYLKSPLSFHNTPPSSVRPRHRNRHVSSQIYPDPSGREHMLLNFYVQGSNSQTKLDNGYLDRAKNWISTLGTISFDDSVKWSKDQVTSLWERGKRAFRYLSGAPLPPPPLPTPPQQSLTPDHKRDSSSGTWSFAGLFSGLRGQRREDVSDSGNLRQPDGSLWTDGEVHAHLVRNDQGYFVFRYLLVDIPNSRSRSPMRVFIEKSSGVQDAEPVQRWDS